MSFPEFFDFCLHWNLTLAFFMKNPFHNQLEYQITLLFCFHIICQKGPNTVMDFLCIWDFHYFAAYNFWPKSVLAEKQCIALGSCMCAGRCQIAFSDVGHRSFLAFLPLASLLGCYTTWLSSFIFMGCKEFGILGSETDIGLVWPFSACQMPSSPLHWSVESRAEFPSVSWKKAIHLIYWIVSSQCFNNSKYSCSPFAAMVAESVSIICALNIHKNWSLSSMSQIPNFLMSLPYNL